MKISERKSAGAVKILALMVALSAVAACLVVVFAQRRRAALPSNSTLTNRIINVTAGGDLQAAINAARAGDTIAVEAGATFIGPFVLPRKAGNEFITIQSSMLDRLPASGERVSPQHARYMPRIVSPGRGEAALRTNTGAHHYRMVGLEFTTVDANSQVYDLIMLGDGTRAQATVAAMPTDLVLDRCYIHAHENQALKRGVALNSGRAEIAGCHISGFKARGQDSQAISGWNGTGPFRIINNYLEGSGENIMFGGADPSIPNLVPSDIEILRNTITKPLSWRGRWTVKNLLELKNARRVRIDGNLLENNWADAQEGVAILFTVRNQEGNAPWSVVEDVEFTNNIVRHSSSGIFILGRDDIHPSQIARRIRIVNNLFDDISGARWDGRGAFMLVLDGPEDVTVEHNTVMNTGNIIVADGTRDALRFRFRYNIVAHNEYGIHGSGGRNYFPGGVITGNAIIGASDFTRRHLAENFFVPTIAAIGFTDAGRGDFRLRPNSPLKRHARGGAADVGCDMDALQRAMEQTTVTTTR